MDRKKKVIKITKLLMVKLVDFMKINSQLSGINIEANQISKYVISFYGNEYFLSVDSLWYSFTKIILSSPNWFSNYNGGQGSFWMQHIITLSTTTSTYWYWNFLFISLKINTIPIAEMWKISLKIIPCDLHSTITARYR